MRAGLAVGVLVCVIGGDGPAGADLLMNPRVDIRDTIADEGGDAAFEVVLTGSSGPVTVWWSTQGLTASEGADYRHLDGFVTVSSEEPAWIEVPIERDMLVEGSEAFLVKLSAAGGVSIGDGVAHGVIRGGKPTRPRCDRNRDGHSDILVGYSLDPLDPRLPHGGPHDTWGVRSTIIERIDPIPESNYLIEAAADFDADGSCDYLWGWHVPDHGPGALLDEIIITAGGPPESSVVLFQAPRPAPTWQVVGADDVNGDGTADVLWWDPDARRLYVWTSLSSGPTEPGLTPVSGCQERARWQPAGLARLDATATPDVIGTDDSGVVTYWSMKFSGEAYLCEKRGALFAAGSGTIAAVGDFDADGFDDLLWETPASNALLGRLTAHFIAARRVVASSPLQYRNADVSDVPYQERRIAGPR